MRVLLSSSLLPSSTHLPKHLWEVVHVGGAKRLGLKALRLEQVLGDIRRVDQHAMQGPLLVSVGVEHNLIEEASKTLNAQSALLPPPPPSPRLFNAFQPKQESTVRFNQHVCSVHIYSRGGRGGKRSLEWSKVC